MAEALGYPAQPVGWGDLAALAREPAGWAARGHPEWGQLRLGKTRRYRWKYGKLSNWKKAIVKLHPEDKIEFY